MALHVLVNNLVHSFIHSFIHSFNRAISIAPLQVHYYSEALPTHCSTDIVLEFHAEAPQTTASEGLAQGSYMAAIERDSNPRPCGRKASNLPMSHFPLLRSFKG